MIFVLCSGWSNLLQIIHTNSTSTTTDHLLKVILTSNIPHENQTFKRFNVRTSGNHIHSNRNTRIVVISKGTQCILSIFNRISNLFAELITFTKLFTNNVNDIISVTIGFSENQCLWNFFSSRK